MNDGDVLIVPELSRIARSITQIFEVIEIVKEKNIVLYSLKENFCSSDKSITSTVATTIFALVAQIERDLISLRTKEAMQAKKAQGLKLGRPKGKGKSKLDNYKDEILKQMSTFYTQCELYEKTGCVHTAKLFVDEKTFFIGEDIAQHNTIDKALGKARLAGVDLSQCFLMVSGRLSSEMVAKAVMHKIPVLVSRTAPTCLGVMIARKFDLTLCGFARENKINIYSGEFRIHG